MSKFGSSWMVANLVGAKKKIAEDVGRALLGRNAASSGCRGTAHDCQRLGCAEEVRAAWRALLFP